MTTVLFGCRATSNFSEFQSHKHINFELLHSVFVTESNAMWDLVSKAAVDKDGLQLQKEATLLFVGSKQSGKSTAIYRFLNRDDVPKPTLALEYTFGRQSRTNALYKDVCNIWEIGGGTLFNNLLSSLVTAQQLQTLTVIIMVDLSKPKTIFNIVMDCLQTIRTKVDSISNDASLNKAQETICIQKSYFTIDETHPDYGQVKMFPFPVIIIGGKYDIFQGFEPEHKKIICRTLRYLAHNNGASLHFFTSKIESLVSRTKALLNNLAFGTALSNYISQDYNKPLIIPFGADAFSQIGESSGDNSTPTIMEWKKIYENTFGLDSGQKAIDNLVDPGNDLNFREIAVDSLKLRKLDINH